MERFQRLAHSIWDCKYHIVWVPMLRHQTQATTEIYLKKIDDDLAVGLRLLEKRDTHIKIGGTMNW